jgi:hypothetical protein
MSFEAKRLRVQLPCNDTTLIDTVAPQACGAQTIACNAQTLCAIPSVLCHFPTNVCQGFNSLCALPTNVCQFPTNACHGFQSLCAFNSCGPASVCGQFSACGPGSPQTIPTTPGCGVTEQPIDPGTIVVDPAQLPVLRQQLEDQLAEIEKAEQALKERGQQ